ncbi:MAG TPA: hypothetical protein VIV12_12435 [Streptosporangiaceae bacterium]
MKYQEAVQEARRLVRQSEDDQWRLAQLTYEQVKAGKTRQKWAQDIGVSGKHAGTLYSAWERFGLNRSSAERASFAEAYAMVRERAGTPEEARRSTDEHQAIGTLRKMAPERKAQVIREALADPDVAVRTLRDPHTRRQLTDAREHITREIEGAAQIREQASPAQRETARFTEHVQVGNHLRLARFHAAEASRQLQDIDDRDDGYLDAFERDAQEVTDAVEWFRVVLRGGRVDEEELARLLEGGA